MQVIFFVFVKSAEIRPTGAECSKCNPSRHPRAAVTEVQSANVVVIPPHWAPRNCKILWVNSGGIQFARYVQTCVIMPHYTSWHSQLDTARLRYDDLSVVSEIEL